MERPFEPDWVSAPGETIADILEERKLSTETFALYLKQDEEFVSRLLVGKEPITDRLAETLARVLGASKEFWLRREAHYRSGSIRLGLACCHGSPACGPCQKWCPTCRYLEVSLAR